MIKKIVLFVVLLLAVPLLAALFIKQDYQVKAAVVINQPKLLVFDYIRFLTNQDNFSVWAAMDPNMQKTSQGVDGTIGYIAGWHSENTDVGTGEQEIIAITEGERIDFELRFYQPFSAVSPAYMQTEALTEQQTRVTWGFAGHMPYPMNLMLVFMDVEGMIAADLQQGLDNLKLILETQPAEPAELPAS
ncbi:SRPBCC family protein [Rheinheimera maricola]|uniref:SRPBCC family protein n=1 Tax=Rheinheimera maricola TaxID=2793282 RepID=A0ABS7XD66_9GAMM|nr:SRPBCC family protein [Rheinheimera maricola]MBZ9613495.1 SRPBCC family protein [Rheinheimera maricola]